MSINRIFYVQNYVGSIAPKLRPTPADRYAVEVIDLADIFTVDRPYIVKKKLKISVQTDELFQRYRHYQYEELDYTWSTLS